MLINEYETTYIARPDLTEDLTERIKQKFEALITNNSGTILVTEDWGKRKFAYAIEKETRGHYTHFVYTGRGDVVHEIERNLRLHESVLRFMTVNLSKEFAKDIYSKEWPTGTPLKREDRPTQAEITA
jgi:small subunit ribosomal protein S6